MLAKILVGVVAAIAVTGVGVYYAMPDNSLPGCCAKKTPEQVALPGEPLPCSADAETPSCCALPPAPACCTPAPVAVDATGLAAVAGGMTLANSAGPKKALVKASLHCCDE